MEGRKKEIRISFCIAVYNTKKYLKECIDSLYHQGISDFEIICVDDCSTDGSYEELTALSDRFPEMRVYRNPRNFGVSYTRNRALRKCRGEYVWFVDSDDYLAPDSAKRYLETALSMHADAVLGRAVAFNEGEKPGKHYGTERVRQVSFAIPDEYYQRDQAGQYCFGVWLGMFRKEFLLSEQICFHEDFSLLEDVMFDLEVGLRARSIVHMDYFGYYYRIRAVSLSHGPSSVIDRKYYENSRGLLREFRNHFKNSGPEYSDCVRLHIIKFSQFSLYWLVKRKEREYIKKELNGLKQEGFYPYRHLSGEPFIRGRDRKTELLYRMLPSEPLFWMIHYACRVFFCMGLTDYCKGENKNGDGKNSGDGGCLHRGRTGN